MYNDLYDIEKLRDDLIKECEAAYFVSGFGGSLVEIQDIENANDNEIISMALDCKMNLNDYRINKTYRKR